MLKVLYSAIQGLASTPKVLKKKNLKSIDYHIEDLKQLELPLFIFSNTLISLERIITTLIPFHCSDTGVLYGNCWHVLETRRTKENTVYLHHVKRRRAGSVATHFISRTTPLALFLSGQTGL